MLLESALISTDSLPDYISTDLSLASSLIPKEVLQGIADLITQIDLSLYGMSSQFDATTATIARSDYIDFNDTFSPINSSSHSQDFSPVYGSETI